LIDGIHQESISNNQFRLPNTKDLSGSYMQLDFGKDVSISRIVIWNRIACCDTRITGTSLSVINNANANVFSSSITTRDVAYSFESSSSTLQPVRFSLPNILYGRYLKLSRDFPASLHDGDGPNCINILGIDEYDINGIFISEQSTPSMSTICNNEQTHFGPVYLVDGVHSELDRYNNYRLPHTQNIVGSYMQLDFGKDVLISRIVIWNRVSSFSFRIIGCRLSITNNAGTGVLSQPINTVNSYYTFEWTAVPQFTVSSRYGGSGGSFDSSGMLRCPLGRYVKSIALSPSKDSRYAGFVSGVSVKCDDSTILSHRIPNDSGQSFSYTGDCSGGYISLNIKSGWDFFGSLSAYCLNDGLTSSEIGSAISTKAGHSDGYSTTFQCFGNQRIVGLTVVSGSIFDAIRFICSDYSIPLTDINIKAAAYSWVSTKYSWAGTTNVILF